MYKQIVVATDGSDLAKRALEHAARLAGIVGARVAICTVIEPSAMLGYADMAGAVFDPLPEMVEAQHEGAKTVLKAAADAALTLGIEADTQVVDNAFPAEGIIAVADKVAADLIVMGSHGRRGFGRLLLGSQTNEVLAHSKVPVLVIR